MPMNEHTDCVALTYTSTIGTQEEAIIDAAWLLEHQDCEEHLILDDGSEILLTNKGKLLKINAIAKVDVILSGDLQQLGIHIETKGQCKINNDIPLNFREGVYINASKIIVDDTIISPNFITLFTPLESDNFIQINKNITTKNLNISTPKLDINALVDSEAACFNECKVDVSFSGKLMLGRPARTNTTPSPEFFDVWREELKDFIYRGPFSNLNVCDFSNYGLIQLIKTKLSSDTNVKFSNNSTTELENSKIKAKSANFEDGCKATLNDTQLFLQTLDVKKLAHISGKNGYIQADDNIDIEGKIKIDRLTILGNNVTINGVVWGGERLQTQISKCLSVNGILGSKDTSVRANVLIVAPGISFNFDSDFDFYFDLYSDFGFIPMPFTLIGKDSLKINTLVTVLALGGTLQGSNIQHMTAVPPINLLGIIFAFDYTNPNLIDSFINLPYGLGLDLPYKPTNANLYNPGSLLRLSLRFVSNFTQVRVLLSIVSFSQLLAPTAINTSITVFETSGTFARAAYRDLFSSTADQNSEVSRVISSINQSIRETLGASYNRFPNLRDPDARREFLNQTTMLDLVNNLLKAKGYCIIGNAIHNIGTNLDAFANEQTTMHQQLNRPTPSFVI